MAQSTAALRSPSVCSRFCASTIFSTSWMFGSWATPPSRANSSGAMAWKPAFEKRRVESLMYSWTPQISEITSTIGWSLPVAGRAS